jgi:hypothetical protein
MQTKEKRFHAAARAEKQVNFVGLHDSNVRSKSNIAILAVSARADNTRMRQVGMLCAGIFLLWLRLWNLGFWVSGSGPSV